MNPGRVELYEVMRKDGTVVSVWRPGTLWADRDEAVREADMVGGFVVAWRWDVVHVSDRQRAE